MPDETEKKPYLYALTYEVTPHPEGITKEEVLKLGKWVGACDAVVIASALYPADGSYEAAFYSVDGRSKETPPAPLNGIEMFKVWVAMAYSLAQMPLAELDDGRRMFALEVFQTVSRALRTGMGEPPKEDEEELCGMLELKAQQNPKIRDEPLTFKQAQEFVGGLVQVVELGTPNDVLLINEEGKLQKLPLNEAATIFAQRTQSIGPTDVIVGDALRVVGKKLVDEVLGRDADDEGFEEDDLAEENKGGSVGQLDLAKEFVYTKGVEHEREGEPRKVYILDDLQAEYDRGRADEHDRRALAPKNEVGLFAEADAAAIKAGSMPIDPQTDTGGWRDGDIELEENRQRAEAGVDALTGYDIPGTKPQE